MAEMIDILSLNNGVAISCCLQSATRAISAMFRSIKLSAFSVHWGRMPSFKCWMLQDSLRMYTITILKFEPLSKFYSTAYISVSPGDIHTGKKYIIGVSRQILSMQMFPIKQTEAQTLNKALNTPVFQFFCVFRPKVEKGPNYTGLYIR